MIAVVGGGRIGVPITQALARSNPEVTLLMRRPETPPKLPANVECLPLSAETDWSSVRAVFFAFPLTVDHDGAVLHRIPQSVPVLSVAASLSLDRHRELLPGRPVGRFMCTPAIQTGRSLVFYDGGSDPEAVETLHLSLPTLSWRPVPSERFDDFTLCIVAAPLLCRALGEFASVLEVGEEHDERLFLAETLAEAKRMLECYGYDPMLAFDRAATPGGLTREYLARAMSQRREDLLAEEPLAASG